jgi:hypothetical protein
MLDDSKNGTLVLDVFGIDPPWVRDNNSELLRNFSIRMYSQSYFEPATTMRIKMEKERKKISVNEPFFKHSIAATARCKIHMEIVWIAELFFLCANYHGKLFISLMKKFFLSHHLPQNCFLNPQMN